MSLVQAMEKGTSEESEKIREALRPETAGLREKVF
jgi:hypothetical protein